MDIIPVCVEGYSISYTFIALLEGVLILQLLLAWREISKESFIPYLYLFAAFFCVRVAYRVAQTMSVFWWLRAAEVHNLFIGFLWYSLGIVLLHPKAFFFAQRIADDVANLSKNRKRIYLIGWFILLALLFWGFKSKHITRDGADWILRTGKPVWHLYMREPLTIGLYRWVFLAVKPLVYVNTYQVISTLSIISGLWCLGWMHRLVQQQYSDAFKVFLAWLLMLSSGGMKILFFGHVEVYPVFIAGLIPTCYYAQEYFHGRKSVYPAAICFSVTFLLHLSAGWLLPAFFLLPLLKERYFKNAFSDVLRFVLIFVMAQIFWWGGLLLFCYQADIQQMLARLHQTFFVGPDRAMFLPLWAWFQGFHLWALFNEYLYLSVSGCVLMPIMLFYFLRTMNRAMFFWFVLFAGYFVYTFFWNPDRGFPEDWDLFSPLVPLLFLFQLQLMRDKYEDEENSSHLPKVNGLRMHERFRFVYIASLGALPFVCAQIWYHHIVPFARI